MPSLFQGPRLEPSLVRCCHVPCGSRPIDYGVNISNKLLLDIRRHIKKYYSVSICDHKLWNFILTSTTHPNTPCCSCEPSWRWSPPKCPRSRSDRASGDVLGKNTTHRGVWNNVMVGFLDQITGTETPGTPGPRVPQSNTVLESFTSSVSGFVVVADKHIYFLTTCRAANGLQSVTEYRACWRAQRAGCWVAFVFVMKVRTWEGYLAAFSRFHRHNHAVTQ